MKIRMLETKRGSPDGVNLAVYEKGQEYDLAATERELDLARAFIRYGWAEEARPPKKHEPEAKAETVTDNKALDGAPENKGRRR